MEITPNQVFALVAGASSSVRNLDDATKKAVLHTIASKLREEVDAIVEANRIDLAAIDAADPKRDRLLLTEARVLGLAENVEEIARLSDPSGELLYEALNENGLRIRKITVPLGVVGVIYESRPNVTVDVAALCIRSGNACILRGGTDALYSNTCLVSLIRESLAECGLNSDAVHLFPPGRELVREMLTAVKFIDIIIPRGSQALIDFVRQNSRVPVIETGAGVCHTYVERTARLDRAVDIVVNAKVSRPSVCNALDTVLVDREIAGEFLPRLARRLEAFNVELFADSASYAILSAVDYPKLKSASADDFGREFLDFKCSVKVVNGLNEAMEHIACYSSKHSEAIVSEDDVLIDRFLKEVDAAAVYANASTRFTDGSVFGLGAEIGISTQKLHARGPFALEKLVTEKWVVEGNGQVRI